MEVIISTGISHELPEHCRNRGGSLDDAEDAAAVLHQLRIEPAHGRHHRVHLNIICESQTLHPASAHSSAPLQCLNMLLNSHKPMGCATCSIASKPTPPKPGYVQSLKAGAHKECSVE